MRNRQLARQLLVGTVAAAVMLPAFGSENVFGKKADRYYDWAWIKGVQDGSVVAQTRLNRSMAGGMGHHRAAASSQRLSLSGDLSLASAEEERRYRDIVMPEWGDRFAGPYTFGDLTAYQDSDLIDPLKYPLTTVQHTQHALSDSLGILGTPSYFEGSLMGNTARMEVGLPPLDALGDPIHLCRLLNSTSAPYYELRRGEAVEAARRSGSAGVSNTCRTGSKAELYWKERARDFKTVLGSPVTAR